ncbi:MAG: PQQ-dependent sugar dehydrogenase [Porticoccaceae bacterium]
MIERGLRRVLLLGMLIFPLPACTQDTGDGEEFTVVEVASGLGVPWGMVFISNDELLFTERSGGIKVLDRVSGKIKTLSGAPEVVASGQGGLLDVATSPDFARDGWLYFTYSKPLDGGQSATALARAKVTETGVEDWSDLFISNLHSSQAKHFGSRIAFDGNGHLFLSHGDRGDRHSAQELNNHGGTVLRLHLDGAVPEDNPFVGRADIAPEIWSYGHRNPQGIVFDKHNQRLWVIEHGPRGGDEINRVEAGRNYGWPVISYGKEYSLPVMVGEGTHKEGMEQPKKIYVPSIAPGSLLLYGGNAFPQWQGSLLTGALALTHLNRVEVEASGELGAEYRYLEGAGERIRAMVESPEGWLYVSTDSGKILRLSPNHSGAGNY